MVLVGLSWLLAWLLYSVFTVTLVHTLLIVAVVFVGLGLLLGERPFINK